MGSGGVMEYPYSIRFVLEKNGRAERIFRADLRSVYMQQDDMYLMIDDEKVTGVAKTAEGAALDYLRKRLGVEMLGYEGEKMGIVAEGPVEPPATADTVPCYVLVETCSGQRLYGVYETREAAERVRASFSRDDKVSYYAVEKLVPASQIQKLLDHGYEHPEDLVFALEDLLK